MCVCSLTLIAAIVVRVVEEEVVVVAAAAVCKYIIYADELCVCVSIVAALVACKRAKLCLFYGRYLTKIKSLSLFYSVSFSLSLSLSSEFWNMAIQNKTRIIYIHI